ncbi:MAG: hypothetical protein AVDCRST_MAG17-2258, partial [uncultured Solirubrobacterales bacterium]
AQRLKTSSPRGAALATAPPPRLHHGAARRRRPGRLRQQRPLRRRGQRRRRGHREAGVRPLARCRGSFSAGSTRRRPHAGRPARSARVPQMRGCQAQAAAAARHSEGQPGPGHRAVQAGVRPPARPGHAVPHLVALDRGRGRRPRPRGDRRRGRQDVQRAEAPVVPERPRVPAVPQGLGPDRGGPQVQGQARRALEPGTRGDRQGQGRRLRRRGPELLQQEQGPVRPAGAARHQRRPDRERGRRPQGPQGARGRRELQGRGRQVLDRRGLQGPGRQAHRRRQGPAGEGPRRCGVRRRAGEAHRPGQDPVRLLRLPGRQGGPRLPAEFRAVTRDHPGPAAIHQGAERPERVRRGLPEGVQGEDQLRQGLHHRPVQERRQAALADRPRRPRGTAAGGAPAGRSAAGWSGRTADPGRSAVGPL